MQNASKTTHSVIRPLDYQVFGTMNTTCTTYTQTCMESFLQGKNGMGGYMLQHDDGQKGC